MRVCGPAEAPYVASSGSLGGMMAKVLWRGIVSIVSALHCIFAGTDDIPHTSLALKSSRGFRNCRMSRWENRFLRTGMAVSLATVGSARCPGLPRTSRQT
eukprot:1671806-Rhodomonas_salina.1